MLVTAKIALLVGVISPGPSVELPPRGFPGPQDRPPLKRPSSVDDRMQELSRRMDALDEEWIRMLEKQVELLRRHKMDEKYIKPILEDLETFKRLRRESRQLDRELWGPQFWPLDGKYPVAPPPREVKP